MPLYRNCRVKITYITITHAIWRSHLKSHQQNLIFSLKSHLLFGTSTVPVPSTSTVTSTSTRTGTSTVPVPSTSTGTSTSTRTGTSISTGTLLKSHMQLRTCLDVTA